MRRYAEFAHFIDVDALEEAIDFEATGQKFNKVGHALDLGFCPDPWHLHKNGDTTGKFALNRDTKRYHCFVCGDGSTLDLVMALKGIEEPEAEEWLFRFTAAIDTTDREFLSEIDALLLEEERAKPIMPHYNEHVLDEWANPGHVWHAWLKERGISDEIAVRARVGFRADATRLAPIRAGKGREEPYTGPSVCLPHFWGGRLVGWQQRWLDEARPKWLPKYTNTSGFPKAETLYNFEGVYLAQRPVVVCESVPTVLFLASFGYPAVATFGSSVTDEQMRLLRYFQQGIVLAPDNDKPGRKWLSYTNDEAQTRRKGRQIERVILAEELARFVPVRVIEPVGEYDSGDDLGALIEEGLPFARKALEVLYGEAAYY